MWILGPLMLAGSTVAAAGETLYNGIVLPETWPPRHDSITTDPLPPPPYLVRPPEVIPIDLGRQLFVDDFLIEQTDLERRFHHTTWHPATPLLTPDREWEKAGRSPTAMPFSDGVWWDPADKLYKMWYMGGYCTSTCYATSSDGIQWDKPSLDVVPGTNIVDQRARDSAVVWLDLEAQDPARRYVMMQFAGGEGNWRLMFQFSADGIHWSEPHPAGPCGDRTSLFYNPFRGVWVWSLREYLGNLPVGRCRRYWETKDLLAGSSWKAGEPTFWVGADALDPQRDDLKTQPQLYNLDCVAYESLVLGLFSIWYGQPKDRAKPNEICAGFSRDGFHWSRPDREPLVPVSERYGDWNWGNVQSAGGGCLVVGDELWFYVSGRSGHQGDTGSGTSATGLAVLRRDGFASLDAGADEGTLTTRPLRFSGKHLFVNLAAPQGELKVEVLDLSGNPLAPFTLARCTPLSGDGTTLKVTWGNVDDLSPRAGKAVRLRFHLKQGSLYSFWVSSDERGTSGGYVAAGGPGFVGPMDR